MKLNNQKVNEIRSDLDEAIANVLNKYGMEGELGSIRYDDSGFSAKMAAKVIGGLTKEAKAYNKVYTVLDLPELGAVVSISGEMYEIVGYNSRAPKYPIQIENLEGKVMKTTVEMIRRAEILQDASN